jgi:hypothetical protein
MTLAMGNAPLVLDRRRTHLLDESRWGTLAARFERTRHLRLPGLLASDLLGWIGQRLATAPFRMRVASRVTPPALDLKLTDGVVHGALHLVLNDPAVIAFVRAVSRSPTIGGYVGAVYRMMPGPTHHDSWHDDVDGNRRVGLTVNLSDAAFAGGELEMRRRGTRSRLWRVANVGPGDGLLFAIDASLQHHVRGVTGRVPKTALAGWFCDDADRRP